MDQIPEWVWRSAAVMGGLYIIASTVVSAVEAFVLPRAAANRLSALVFVTSRRLFDLRLWFTKRYVVRDRIMAIYAPLTLLAMPIVWLTCLTLGYGLVFWGMGDYTPAEAFLLSGSSILTLGLAGTEVWLEQVVAFSAATIGLILVALLISYLPTMYSAYSNREAAVTRLDVRAGSPPSAIEMILRLHRIGRLHDMDSFWEEWEKWFAQLEEQHTSLPALVYYRSPVPEYSWVTASGTVLDAAALCASTLDKPRNPREDLCLRAGYLALRRIAGFFRVAYKEDVSHEDPISIKREEFDEACDALAAAGVPIVADRDQAWRDFAGWRVNYDTVLLALCGITMAPYAPWSSDRAAPYRIPFIFPRDEG